MLLPAVLVGQLAFEIHAKPVEKELVLNHDIPFGMYICTTGNDEIFRGDFRIVLTNHQFKLMKGDSVILLKRITNIEGNRLCYDGGYLEVSFKDGDLYSVWRSEMRCNKTYYYHKNWGLRQ
jgi:hypothetical protein